jgi:hypothetical protein
MTDRMDAPMSVADYERRAKRMETLAAKAVSGSDMHAAILKVAASYRALAKSIATKPAAKP